jgi:hypothetical protein
VLQQASYVSKLAHSFADHFYLSDLFQKTIVDFSNTVDMQCVRANSLKTIKYNESVSTSANGYA